MGKMRSDFGASKITTMSDEFIEDWILATSRLKDQTIELPSDTRRRWIHDVQLFYLENHLVY